MFLEKRLKLSSQNMFDRLRRRKASEPDTDLDIYRGFGMNNRSSSNRTKARKPLPWMVIVITVALVVFISYFIWAYLWDPNGSFSFTPAKVDTVSSQYALHLVTNDTADPSKTYAVDLLMSSRSFSAQYPITVESISSRQLNGTAQTKTLFIVFNKSDYSPSDPTQRPELDYFDGVPFSLSLPKNATWYNNTGTYGGPVIQYPMQGCFNIAVTTNSAYFRNHQAYKSDCSQMNIASLEATSAMKDRDAQVSVTNSALNLAASGNRTSFQIYGAETLALFVAMMVFYRDIYRRRER